MKNLAKAIISVMNDIKGIEKTMTVGEGRMSYKGVPDQEVKKIIKASMVKNGLCLLPIKIEPTTRVERWEEADNYGKVKMKQTVFTEVNATYLLMHESGESQEISGYGQGVDSQDKGAGKATTYALKYALLYSFLVPTGDIDDADSTHSQDHVVNQIKLPKPKIDNAILTSSINATSTIEGLNNYYQQVNSAYELTQEQIKLFSAHKTKLS